MKRFIFIIAMTLVATGSAYAQIPQGRNPVVDAMRDPDLTRREERLINLSSRRIGIAEREKSSPMLVARSVRRSLGSSAVIFKSQVVITNNSPKTIQSVSWIATLTHPKTGEVIRSYDVTVDARVAPGKRKVLTQKLMTPRNTTVDANNPTNVADLKSTITRITYADGSTSTVP